MGIRDLKVFFLAREIYVSLVLGHTLQEYLHRAQHFPFMFSINEGEALRKVKEQSMNYTMQCQ